MRGIAISEDTQLPERADPSFVTSTLARLSFPLILRGLFMSFVQFFLKRHILAKKDNSLLAAYGGFSAIEGFIFILIFHSLHIISAKASALHDDKKNPEKIGKLYREGLIFGSMLMLPALILSMSAKSIFEYMNQPAVVINNSHQYFSAGMIAYFFDMLYRVQARIAIGIGDVALPLIGDGVESVVDVIVTDILVNGRFGLPEMGVCSASWGYAAGAAAALISSTCYLKYAPDYQQYELFHFRDDVDQEELKNTISGGLHIALTNMAVDVPQALITFCCGLSGEASLVGLQAAGAYGYLVSLPIDGMLEAATVLIGRFYEKNAKRFSQISFLSLLVVVGFAVFSAILSYANTERLAEFFVSSDAAHRNDFEIVQKFLWIQAWIEIVNSINNPCVSFLNGCRETRYPFLLSSAFIFVLNSALIASTYFGFHAGSVAAFGVQLVGLTLCAAGSGLRWKKELNRSIFWKKPDSDIEMKVMMRSESARQPDPNESFPALTIASA